MFLFSIVQFLLERSDRCGRDLTTKILYNPTFQTPTFTLCNCYRFHRKPTFNLKQDALYLSKGLYIYIYIYICIIIMLFTFFRITSTWHRAKIPETLLYGSSTEFFFLMPPRGTEQNSSTHCSTGPRPNFGLFDTTSWDRAKVLNTLLYQS